MIPAAFFQEAVKLAAARLPPSTPPRPRDMPIHAQQRALERTKVHPDAVAKLQQRLGQMKLEKGKTYHHPWPEGGYAVIAPVGKRGRKHVVKTTLAPHMSPPGYQLPPFSS